MIKKLFFAFLLSMVFAPVFSQPKENKGIGKLSGRVVDSLSGQALEYATISIIRQDDNKVIDGATTDNSGTFRISNIPEGTYKVLFYFIGYQTSTKTGIVISASKPEINLGAVQLANRQILMKEVTVSTERSSIENKIDKIVYNADKDVTSQGGVATDLLKKIPMVAVNADGSIELQGNSNIRFLINGKPSSVFGNNIADVLQTIPSSQIQSIEVITSPGAKYDAEGTGGIINIILRKSTVQGMNGNISLTGGSRLQNGSVNLGARKGKFGANAYLSGNAQISSKTLSTMDRESYDSGSNTKSSLIQDGSSDFIRMGYQAGLSFDYSMTEKDNLNGGFSYNNFGNKSTGITDRQSLLKDESGNVLSDIVNRVNANNNFNTQAYDWNLNYKHKFKKEEQELDLMYTASASDNYSYYKQTQSSGNSDYIFSGSYGKNPGTDQQHNFSLNYTHPLNEKVLIETGAKTTLYQISSHSDVYLLNSGTGDYDYNTAQSNRVSYGRNIYAAYLSGTFKLKVLDVKAGIRDEYTESMANFSNTGKVNINPYNTIVPSGIMSHTFKHNHTLKLSYSYRIQRPDYRDLNPFLNASDPKNISTGNPALKPETTHNIELGYSKFFDKGINLNVNAFYRGNRADIQSYTRYYPTYLIGDSTYTNVALSTRENIGREDNFGLNIFASANIKKKFSLRTNLSFFQRYIYNSIVPGANISGFNYRINLNATYQITETFIAEVFGNFNSPRINVQGKMPAFTTYNFALRKQFYHKKMSLAFTTANPFNKYVKQKTETTGTNFTLTSLRQMPYRSFGLNFTWKFGKLEFKKQREAEDVNLTNPPGGGN
ncbi:MAG: TonB-dependent receptor [Bacteroidetes bacterium]|nr:TonB-dependent receptor [Bacteroidota bacterium]